MLYEVITKADRKLREGVKLQDAEAETEDMEREFSGAIFTWALRGAVAIAGHYNSAKDALGFYQKAADEINAACDSGEISCKSSALSYAPSFPWDKTTQLVASTRITSYNVCYTKLLRRLFSADVCTGNKPAH